MSEAFKHYHVIVGAHGKDASSGIIKKTAREAIELYNNLCQKIEEETSLKDELTLNPTNALYADGEHVRWIACYKETCQLTNPFDNPPVTNGHTEEENG